MDHVPLLNLRELALSSRTMFESALYQDKPWQPGPSMDYRDEVHTRSELGTCFQPVPEGSDKTLWVGYMGGGSNPYGLVGILTPDSPACLYGFGCLHRSTPNRCTRPAYGTFCPAHKIDLTEHPAEAGTVSVMEGYREQPGKKPEDPAY